MKVKTGLKKTLQKNSEHPTSQSVSVGKLQSQTPPSGLKNAPVNINRFCTFANTFQLLLLTSEYDDALELRAKGTLALKNVLNSV